MVTDASKEQIDRAEQRKDSNKAKAVHNYFVGLMENDSSKIYWLIEGLERGEHELLEIKGCQKLHMIAHF